MKTLYVQFCEVPGAEEQIRWQLLYGVVAQVSVNCTQTDLINKGTKNINVYIYFFSIAANRFPFQ